MTLPRPCLPLALLAFSLAAAPAQAEGPVPLLAAPRAQDVAIAGSDVVVTRDDRVGGVRVDALPSGGGPARRLLTAAPPGRRWDAFAAVAASPQRVAVTVLYTSPSFESFEARLYSGPASGPLELVEQGRERAPWTPVDAAVDGDRVLVLESGQDDATRLRLLVPGGPPRVVPTQGSITGPVALAGDRLAFQSDDRVFVVDANTGARVLAESIDDEQLDLAGDGSVVAHGHDQLFTVGPGRPRLPVVGSELLSHPHFAGSAIAALALTRFGAERPVVLDPGATEPRPIGLPSFSIQEIDADARGVAWIANGCVLYTPVGAPRPSELPIGPCPRVEVDVTGASTTMRGRMLRLEAFCVAAPATGCAGTVKIRRRGIVGRGHFDVARGRARHFGVRLSRRGARIVRRRLRHHPNVLLPLTTRTVDGPPGGGLIYVERAR